MNMLSSRAGRATLQQRFIDERNCGRQAMSELYGLKLEPMPNNLVNYGVTENGIAVIELASDSAGAPLQGDNQGPNTYTH